MPTLKTKLTPFWYEPEFQGADKARFRLRPLTERDMIELQEFCGENGSLTARAQYEAGIKAITAAEGFKDEDGAELRWPNCAPYVDRNLITQAGFRAIIAQTGGDWSDTIARIRAEIDGAPPAPATPGEAEKN